MARESDCTVSEVILAQTLASQSEWRSRDSILSHGRGLAAILDHAVSTVPFYQKQLSGRNVPFSDIPIVDRTLVSSRRQEFISSQVSMVESPLFARTSGSSGWPLTVRFGAADWYELNQATYRRIAAAYPQLNELATPGKVSVVMVHDGAHRQTTDTLLFELSYSVFSRVVLRGNTSEDTNLLSELRSIPIPLLYGKPANLLKLARLDCQLGGMRRIRPRFLFTSGENLYRDQRKELESSYECNVINSYGSLEGGMIALQCPIGDRLHVDNTRSHLEILRSSGEIRADGEGELVLTNLWNWTMPFIRYRTADFGVLESTTCPCGHRGQTLSRLDGREVGRFETLSGPVETQQFDELFVDLCVEQFQLEQLTASEFDFRWVATTPSSANNPSVVISQRIRGVLGNIGLGVSMVSSIQKVGFKSRRYFSRLQQRGRPEMSTVSSRVLRSAAIDPCVATVDMTSSRVAIAHPLHLDIVNLKSDFLEHRIKVSKEITCMRFSPADDVLIVGDCGGHGRILDVKSCDELFQFDVAGVPRTVAFSADGSIAIVGSSDGSISTFSVPRGAACAEVKCDSTIVALATSAISQLLAVTSEVPYIELRDLPSLDLVSRLALLDTPTAIDFMVDENILAVGVGDRVQLWNVDTEDSVAEFQHRAPVTAVGFYQPRQLVFAGTSNGDVRNWDFWRGTSKADFRADETRVNSFAFLANGAGYSTLHDYSLVKLWSW